MKKKKIVVLIMCVIAAVLISGGLFYFNKNYTWAFAVYQKGQSTAASVPSTADSLPLPQPSMPDSERYAPFAKDRVAEITKTDNWQAEVNVDNFQCYIELNYNFDKSVNYNDYTLSYEITKYLNNGKQQVTYGNGEFSQKDKKIGVGIILPSYKHRDRSWLEPATYAVQIFFTPTNDNSSLSPITCGTYIFAVNERGFVSGNQKNSEVV
jgi:uncharacterized protein YxeA